ncbi:hypothetical protein [Paenibacillus sp. FSL R7-269]|uniref:hypothetical protein n=1 Tax=Paenibacillus sp. FSL R7-269 TaxID=1226755 RepID=UPI0004B0273C|nr:hypothetical protein [Paenibacillus sp. FSL R7-269]
MEELHQIALDLLDAYYHAEQAVIAEYSTHTERDFAELEREVSGIRERIASIT